MISKTITCYKIFIISIVIALLVIPTPYLEARSIKPLTKAVKKITSKYGDEGAEIAALVTRKYSDEVTSSLLIIISSIPSHKADILLRVVDIIPESQIRLFSELCQKYPLFIDTISSTRALKYIKNYPDNTEHLYKVLTKFHGQQTIELFEALNRLPSSSADHIIQTLATLTTEKGSIISEAHLINLHRILHGKTYNSKHIDELIQAFRGNIHNKALGDLAEEMAISAINGKRFPNKHLLDLKPNSKVIKGQYDSVHGIDLIGIDRNGRPVILEVTTGKDFSQMVDGAGRVEMSPEWVLNRWELFTKQPNNVEQLKIMGIDEKYLPPNILSIDDVKNSFNRKVIAPRSASINRIQKSGMSGLNDIIRL
jgi:hypothetical protein